MVNEMVEIYIFIIFFVSSHNLPSHVMMIIREKHPSLPPSLKFTDMREIKVRWLIMR